MTIELAPGAPRDLLVFNPRIRGPGKLAWHAYVACLVAPSTTTAWRNRATLDAIPNYREESQFENVASRRQLPAQTMCRRPDRCAWQLAFKTIDARRQVRPL